MSWHFLERWLEKANQHSTLVGKFWITFLIVCRMVIVASVGDRVYSDEQSEFKCNTLQPGCTNVCFNKFSPISHLRFWSFQILLVATPSVMFIIYSGHDQKSSKGAKSKKSIKKNVSKQSRKTVQGKSGGSDEKNKSNNNNNYNTNNNNGNSINECNGKSKSSPTRRAKDRERRSGREKGANEPLKHYGDAKRGSQILHAMATVVDYRDGSISIPASSVVVDERNASQWQEMRWNTPCHVAQTRNSRTEPLTREGMWIKPRNARKRSKEDNDPDKDDKRKAPNADVILWGSFSSDDDNRQRKCRDAMPSSLAEADMYQNGREEELQEEFEKEHKLAMLSSHPPPEYPGNEWSPQEFDTKHMTKKSKGFTFSDIGIVKTRTKSPRFTRHFHLYLLSVLVRLGFEVFFLFMQIKIFGFSVPALYKCEQWPCPNKVDCFISRPMEKTIFLHFMLFYTCLCVLLNTCEMKYLIWVYVFGRPKLTRKSRARMDEENGEPPVIYDSKGEPKYATRSLEDDSEFDETDLTDEEECELGADKNACDDGRERDRRRRGRKGGRDWQRYKDKMLQEKKADMRHHELDLILNAEEMQDEYDMDIAQNDPVEDIMQMDMTGGDAGGGGDDYNN